MRQRNRNRQTETQTDRDKHRKRFIVRVTDPTAVGEAKIYLKKIKNEIHIYFFKDYKI